MGRQGENRWQEDEARRRDEGKGKRNFQVLVWNMESEKISWASPLMVLYSNQTGQKRDEAYQEAARQNLRRGGPNYQKGFSFTDQIPLQQFEVFYSFGRLVV